MDDRSNTIAGWVLGGGIAALGLSIASGMYFHAETPEAGKQGYAIEGVESSEAGGTAAVPIATLLATADVTKGEGIFKKCIACHTIAAGAPNGIGPNLHGVLGKTIGSHAGFNYSEALKSKGGAWAWENMSEWLANPKKFAPGNKMTFAGLGNPEDRAAVLVYINSQGSNLPLPAAPAPEAASEAGTAEGAPEAGTEGPGPGEATKTPSTDAPTQAPAQAAPSNN